MNKNMYIQYIIYCIVYMPLPFPWDIHVTSNPVSLVARNLRTHHFRFFRRWVRCGCSAAGSQQFLSQRGSWLPVKAQEDRQSWKSWGEISSWKKAGIMEKRDPFFGGNQTWYKYCWKKNWGIIVQLVWVGHIMNPGNLAWELKHRVILEDCVFSLEQRGWFLGSIFR